MRAPMLASRATVFAAGAAISFLGTTQAIAGAFQINERSAVAQGTSFAGSVSSASDVTHIGFNPAALTTVEHMEIGGNASLISPISNGTVQTGPFAGTELDADRIGLVPAIAAGYRLTNDLIIGLSTHSPFGLRTEYSNGSPVAADATKSELLTLAIAPMAAYEISDTVTLGASVNFLYADAVLDSAVVELEGDDYGFGFSVGALIEPVPGTTIGVAYHHGYDLNVQTSSFGGLSGDVEASLPNWIQVGITHDFSDDLRLMAEGRWINWSRFDSIDINTPGAGPVASVQDVQNYEDAFFGAIGAEYDLNDSLTLRTGVAYDQTPTTDAFRTVRVPDEDRLWLSLGASYKLSDAFQIDAAYSYLHGLNDPEVTLRNGPLAGTQVDYEGGAHIFSVGGSIRF